MYLAEILTSETESGVVNVFKRNAGLNILAVLEHSLGEQQAFLEDV